MTVWPMRLVSRRSFVVSLLIAPMACLGCGGDGVSVNAQVAEKRTRKIAGLQKKAELKRKSQGNRRPAPWPRSFTSVPVDHVGGDVR
jgi:hypothetical protein